MQHASRLLIAAALAFAGGCQAGDDDNVPEAGPPSISGGGLLVTEDATYAVASDPARAAIHVVDLRDGSDRRINLGAGDFPGRAVEDGNELVHVVLRDAGEVLTLDPDSASPIRRRAVCNTPRGIDVTPGGELVVACAEGLLAYLPTGDGPVSRRVSLRPDLRDVVALEDGRLLVSRFRSAEVLMVEGGAITETIRPLSGVDSIGRQREPTVAWRLRAHANGALLVHQESTRDALGPLGAMTPVYYGADCNSGVVRTVYTVIDTRGETAQTSGAAVPSASLVVDGDMVGRGTIALAAAAEPSTARGSGGSGVRTTGIFHTPSMALNEVPTCNLDAANVTPDYERSAIAVSAVPGTDRYLVQMRDPGQLVLMENGRPLDTYALAGGRVTNLGHALFHEAAGTGSTCAGCHPEGGDDGHVWRFDSSIGGDDLGHRRTQTMTGNILATAPFHWAGDVPNIGTVFEGTFVFRMGGVMPREDEVSSFESWVAEIPATPAPTVDEAPRERGRLVFERPDVGCTTCHGGTMRTNNQTADVGSGRFQVPALYEVVYHAPYLHDGSAETLEELVDMHGNTGVLTDDEKTDLIVYLRSL